MTKWIQVTGKCPDCGTTALLWRPGKRLDKNDNPVKYIKSCKACLSSKGVPVGGPVVGQG